jgi:hypothetical protein
MTEIHDIAGSLGKVLEAAETLRIAAGDRQKWSSDVKEASTSMLTIVEELRKSLERMLAKVTDLSGRVGPAVADSSAVEEKISVLGEATRRGLSDLGETVFESNLRVASLGDEQRAAFEMVAKSFVKLAEVVSEIPTAVREGQTAEMQGVVNAVSSVVQGSRDVIVQDIDSLGVALGRRMEDVPDAVSRAVAKAMESFRTQTNRDLDKLSTTVSSYFDNVASELRRLNEEVAKLSAKKKGLFRD